MANGTIIIWMAVGVDQILTKSSKARYLLYFLPTESLTLIIAIASKIQLLAWTSQVFNSEIWYFGAAQFSVVGLFKKRTTSRLHNCAYIYRHRDAIVEIGPGFRKWNKASDRTFLLEEKKTQLLNTRDFAILTKCWRRRPVLGKRTDPRLDVKNARTVKV